GAQRVGTDAHAVVVAARARERGDEGVGERCASTWRRCAALSGSLSAATSTVYEPVGGGGLGRRAGAATGVAAGAAATRVAEPRTSTRTRTVPGPTMPMVRAAAYERSMARPPTNGPR